jgi:uncharacterized membrane protein required for colicin V production
MNVGLDQGLLLNILIAICAVLGLRRGVAKEMVLLVGVIIGSLFAPTGGPYVPALLAAGQKAFTQLTQGGNAQAAVTAMSYSKTMDLIMFGIILLLSLVISRIISKPAKGFSSRLFGALVGGLNGFLIGRFAFPRLFAEPETVLVISGLKTQSQFSPVNTATAVVVFVIVLIGLGIRQSTPPKKKQT